MGVGREDDYEIVKELGMERVERRWKISREGERGIGRSALRRVLEGETERESGRDGGREKGVGGREMGVEGRERREL